MAKARDCIPSTNKKAKIAKNCHSKVSPIGTDLRTFIPKGMDPKRQVIPKLYKTKRGWKSLNKYFTYSLFQKDLNYKPACYQPLSPYKTQCLV